MIVLLSVLVFGLPRAEVNSTKAFFHKGANSLWIDLYFFPLNLCTLYFGLLGTESVIEGMEGLFVYQVSAEDKSAPVAYRRRQLGVVVSRNVW